MNTMIEYLDGVRNGSKFFYEYESKKSVMQRKLNEFYSLIDARAWVGKNFIYNAAGIEDKVYLTKSVRGNEVKTQISYLQLYNVLVKYALTGKLLNRPYNVTNKEKLSLIKEAKWNNY